MFVFLQKYFGRIIASTGHYKFRVVRVTGGYEPQQFTNSGIGPSFWTPLKRTGYWAEPDSFTLGIVTAQRYPQATFESAKDAALRAFVMCECDPTGLPTPLRGIQ